jgi:hypothetical protein
MNARKSMAIAATILTLGMAPVLGHAQQSTSPSSGASSSGSGKASTLTGGAEGNPTDQATPGTGAATQGSSSGASGTASTMTGGAEGKPTEQGTAAESTMPPKDKEGVVRPAKAREENK